MKARIDQVALDRAFASAKTPTERTLYFPALLSAAMDEPPNFVVLVGGSAIEVYTSGEYVSDDIDIVATRAQAIPILESWGFRTLGRTWFHEGWKLDVDLVNAPSSYTGSKSRIREIATRYGPVRVTAPEDLIIRRLAEAKHRQGRQQETFEQALMIATEYAGDLDEAYLDQQARREDVVDILAELRRQVRT
jgi:hypothetical protein